MSLDNFEINYSKLYPTYFFLNLCEGINKIMYFYLCKDVTNKTENFLTAMKESSARSIILHLGIMQNESNCTRHVSSEQMPCSVLLFSVMVTGIDLKIINMRPFV